MEAWTVIYRAAFVLLGCIGGLVGAGLVYYAFFEDTIVTSGNQNSRRTGMVLRILAIASFCLSVYFLYLDILPGVLIALLAIFVSRLTWNLGDGMVHAGEVYEALAAFERDPDPVTYYLRKVRSYREVQDLRRVARLMYDRSSQTLASLEDEIRKIQGANYPRLKDTPDSDNGPPAE